MSTMGPESVSSMQRQGDGRPSGATPPARADSSGGPPWGLLLTGLVVVGLGVLAWNVIGPDLRRYIKISNM